MSKIIILLATYNGASFLKDQLDSILSQTNHNWELLIHDDNSTDGTVQIIKEYTKIFSNKITFMDDTLSLNSAKENFSFLLQQLDPKYQYIMFSDQDDIWHKNKIEVTLNKMKTIEKKIHNAPVLVHTDLIVTDENLTILSPSFWDYAKLDQTKASLSNLLMQNNITGCTMMINQILLQKALPIAKGAVMHDWWMGLVAAKFGTIGWVENTTMLYRQHNNNDTGAKPFNLTTICNKILSYSDKTLLHSTLQRNIKQAEAFLKTYNQDLTIKEIKMLESFSRLNNLSPLEKRIVLLKNGLLKNGLLRNIGLLSRI